MLRFALLGTLTVLVLMVSADPECIVTLPDVEGVFDLRNLQGTTWQAQTANGQYSFEFQICGSVPMCNGHQDAAVCQQWIGGEASCGVWNASTIETMHLPTPGASGVGLAFSLGDENRFSHIFIHCDPLALLPVDFTATSAETFFNPYIIEFTSAAGCNVTLPPAVPVTPSMPVPLPPPEAPVVQPVALPEPVTVIVPQAIPVAVPIEVLPVPVAVPIAVPIESPPTPIPQPIQPIAPPVGSPTLPINPHSTPSAKPKKLSVGSILLITLACLLVVYFVGGFVFNKVARQKPGAEAIPNYEFWVGLPGLMRDGFYLLFRPCGLKDSRSYEMIRA